MILLKNCNLADGINDDIQKNHIVIEKSFIKDILKINEVINEDNFSMVLDTSDYVTVPGFLDIHSHGDLNILDKDKPNPKLMQGVTTEIIGNCGLSFYPINKDKMREWYNMYRTIWGELSKDNLNNLIEYGDYTGYIEKEKIPVNVALIAGLGALKANVSGFTKIEPDTVYPDKLINSIEKCFDSGVKGISTGTYPPNSFISEQEMLAVCRLVKKYDKYISFHIRDEGDNIFESIDEVYNYIRDSGCRTQISHLKSYGKRNWNKNKEILKKVEDISYKGYEISFDQYPYTAGSTTFIQVLPPYVLEGGLENTLNLLKNKNLYKKIEEDIDNGIPGWENYANLVGWENIQVSGLSGDMSEYENRTVSEIAVEIKLNPVETAVKLILEEKGAVSMLMFAMDENNIKQMMKSKIQMFGSDGLYYGKPHPRTYGTFPRVLSKYCREEKTLNLIEAIKKMTSISACKAGIKDRGCIKKGNYADIVIFDYEKIKDTADYNNPEQFPEGIKYVFVNGELAVENNRFTGVYSGSLIK